MNNQDPAATGGDTPIFDALAQQAPVDPLEDIALSDAVPADSEPELAPDAAARDAAKREEAADGDQALSDTDFRFITRGTTEAERAAVVAVLTKVRAEETERVKRVERREHQPWSRSQRVPEGIGDLLAEG